VVDRGVNLCDFSWTDESYRRLARLHSVVWPEDTASSDWLARFDRERDAGRPITRRVMVGDDGRYVGAVETGPARWSDDPRRFELHVMVEPAARRRGVGGRLWDEGLAMAAGRADVVEGATTEDRAEAVAFLEARGCRRLARNPQSELDVATFDASRWAGLVERVIGSGVRLVALARDRAGREPVLPDLWALFRRCLSDVPGQARAVAPPFDVWRRSFDTNPDLRPETHILARCGGQLVGMTQLWGSQANPGLLYTGFTGVEVSFRRRGIATAMKIRSLQAAQRLADGIRGGLSVRTSNEESNSMLRINHALGFVEGPARLIYERRITG
jgi:ribosomal protein S18 acetylase RimI-like enzyme